VRIQRSAVHCTPTQDGWRAQEPLATSATERHRDEDSSLAQQHNLDSAPIWQTRLAEAQVRFARFYGVGFEQQLDIALPVWRAMLLRISELAA
jgi:hypothetical protein